LSFEVGFVLRSPLCVRFAVSLGGFFSFSFVRCLSGSLRSFCYLLGGPVTMRYKGFSCSYVIKWVPFNQTRAQARSLKLIFCSKLSRWLIVFHRNDAFKVRRIRDNDQLIVCVNAVVGMSPLSNIGESKFLVYILFRYNTIFILMHDYSV